MLSCLSTPALPYDGTSPQWSAGGFAQTVARFGVNCYRSNLSINPDPDLPRAKAWGAFFAKNPQCKMIFDYAPSEARPSTAQVQADVRAARLFFVAMVSAGASWSQLIPKGMNEPASLESQPWNPDPALIQVHKDYYATLADAIPEITLTGSPTFFGGNDGSTLMMAMWSAAAKWTWGLTLINASPNFPGVGLTLGQWGSMMNWAIERQVNAANQCFTNAHPMILEMTPDWKTFMATYDPIKHGQIVWQAFNSVPVGGHLINGGIGTFNVFTPSDSASEPIVGANGVLTAMGQSMVTAMATAITAP